MATTAEADRTPKRKLIDLLLTESNGLDLAEFTIKHRAEGDSWADVTARVYAATGETITVTWLIRQCGGAAGAEGATE